METRPVLAVEPHVASTLGLAGRGSGGPNMESTRQMIGTASTANRFVRSGTRRTPTGGYGTSTGLSLVSNVHCTFPRPLPL